MTTPPAPLQRRRKPPPPKRNRRNNAFYAADGTPLEEGDPAGALKNEADAALLRNVPPHSPDAEQAALGAILLDPDSLLNIAPILRAEDFYLPAHKLIYAACTALADAGAPVDLLSVKNHLQEHDLLDKAGGPYYLTSLAETAVSSFRGEYHAAIVRDKARVRAMIRTCSEIITEGYDSGLEVSDFLDRSESAILSVADSRTDHFHRSVKESVSDVLREITERAQSDNPLTGLNTGYHRLNDLTGGLQKANLIIIAARPGMGKTALALNLAVNAAKDDDKRRVQGVPVAFFSLEMSLVELTQRLLCSEGNVNLNSMRRGGKPSNDEWENIRWAADRLGKTKIFIDDTPALSIDALRSRARRLQRKENIRMVLVDYLQLMRPAHQSYSREQEIAEISRGLKALAKELGIPVVAMAQLNREVEKRAKENPLTARPQLSDLRESGAIEQDADLILMISSHAPNEEEPNKPRLVPIVVAKHRNGSTGEFYLQYLPSYTRFIDAPPPDPGKAKDKAKDKKAPPLSPVGGGDQDF